MMNDSLLFPKSKFLCRALAVLWLVAFAPDATFGAPVIETYGRMELNWSTLRIRFYGEAQVDKPNSKPFADSEKGAWQEGLNYISEAVRDYHIAAHEERVADTRRLSEDANRAARSITTSTYSYSTTYYGDGWIRVHMENLLPRVLQSSGLRFRQREVLGPAVLQYSGVVFETDAPLTPRPIYQVVDENGHVLFDVTDMAEDAFKRNLMGHWFQAPTDEELLPAVGKNPIIIKASIQSGGRFQVRRHQWDQLIPGHQGLLVNGQIAIALP